MQCAVRKLALFVAAALLPLLGTGQAAAQAVLVSPRVVTYAPATPVVTPVVSYYSAPAVYTAAPAVSYSYYTPAVTYAPAPAVSYYTPTVSYYTPTVTYYTPTVSYYAAPAVVTPAAAVTTTRYGLFGHRQITTTRYYAPTYVYP
jgi:hypothetical protein